MIILNFLLVKSFLKDSAYVKQYMQAKQYSITTMATHSKTFYHSSELEIGKNKGMALREKKKTSCSITPEVKKIIRKGYKKQGLMNRRKQVRL